MSNKFTFDTFLEYKDQLRWNRKATWKPGLGAVVSLVWQGYVLFNGKVSQIPSFFAYISMDNSSGMVGIMLTANVLFDPKGKGQQVIDRLVVGKKTEISNDVLVELLQEKYGVDENLDFSLTPVSLKRNFDPSEHPIESKQNFLARKTLYNKTDHLIALAILSKIIDSNGVSYQVSALINPASKPLNVNKVKSHPPKDTAKDGMSDFQGLIRTFKNMGFTDDIFVPEGVSDENWDFELGVSKQDAQSIRDSFNAKKLDYKYNDAKTDLGEFDDLSGYGDFSIKGSFKDRFTKVSQMNASISDYYQGPMPDASQLDSYVGTPNVDASQIRGIFGGVDEAISLVNQFDSSMLVDVAFIYNFSGGGAYGVYMSALDEEIKNAKLKNILKQNGYQVEDQSNGGFYATHPDKTKEQIDGDIASYRQKISSSGATTFGIDMNKVVGAAKADASDANITDPNDQRLLGILHLGATMVHEAIHSKGSSTEGPSEQGEAKFMAWAMPIINEQRRKSYESQNKLDDYSPLIVDHSQRRMASTTNWIERAEAEGVIKTAQYGAQFLHNQNFTSHMGPAQWAASFWNYGAGAIESMLDQARPYQKNISKISFEGQLRAQNKNKWVSDIDTGDILEELLESRRDPLVAYKTIENLMEDGREKPLMLPVVSKKSLHRKASYDKGKEAFGYMSNLDLPMEDRVQEFDYNDEETTWFDRKFIANQVRYNPEYGNVMSKEDGIYMWWVDMNGGPTLINDPSEEHSSLKTSPWPRVASCNHTLQMLSSFLELAMQNIANNRIKGTRLICPCKYVPIIEKMLDAEDAISVFDFTDVDSSKVWIVDKNVSQELVELAESYLCGESEDDDSYQAFEAITSISRVRDEGVSKMISTVQSAVREAGISKMLILGDFPLAIQTGEKWDSVRTIDFCAEDPDACLKIGEIVCREIGAVCEDSDDREMIVAHWNCMTFRFLGDCNSNEFCHACDVHGRLLTPLTLAMDILTENIIDPMGESLPDVDAEVVRTIIPVKEAIDAYPLIIIDAIFLASRFGFSIDAELAQEASRVRLSDPDVKAVWEAIRVSGKGKSISIAEEYGMEDVLLRLMGEKLCQYQ